MKFIFSFLFLLSSCSSLIYQPDHFLWGDPAQFGVKYNQYNVNSFDGTKLVFWDLYSEEKAENLVFMAHGNAQNMSAHIFNLLWLTKFKSDLITFDYRGYGLSEGDPEPKGVSEDTLKALNVAYDKYKAGKYKKFVVYTQSLGGNVTLKALEEFQFKNEISLLVLDSTFKNTKEVAKEKVSILGNIITDKFSPNPEFAHITMPTLIIHSKYDKVINFKFGEDLFNRIPAKEKYFWILESGNHGDVFSIQNRKYRQDFINLLK